MPVNSVLRHRGIEAWLENSNGSPIALKNDANIDSNNISTWVDITPRQVSLPTLEQSSLAILFSIVLYT